MGGAEVLVGNNGQRSGPALCKITKLTEEWENSRNFKSEQASAARIGTVNIENATQRWLCSSNMAG